MPAALWFASRTGAASETTLDDLWKDFDPKGLPLETEISTEHPIAGGTLRIVYYTSELVQGFKVRVAAYFGFPSGDKKRPPPRKPQQ